MLHKERKRNSVVEGRNMKTERPGEVLEKKAGLYVWEKMLYIFS
jgi:hypothetical protein